MGRAQLDCTTCASLMIYILDFPCLWWSWYIHFHDLVCSFKQLSISIFYDKGIFYFCFKKNNFSWNFGCYATFIGCFIMLTTEPRLGIKASCLVLYVSMTFSPLNFRDVFKLLLWILYDFGLEIFVFNIKRRWHHNYIFDKCTIEETKAFVDCCLYNMLKFGYLLQLIRCIHFYLLWLIQ